ncbi:hypothetical protein [Corynebacterium anserum]|nr:hypothetical protein [Corynebacterium anserum]
MAAEKLPRRYLGEGEREGDPAGANAKVKTSKDAGAEPHREKR